jgi:hypothetical protein
MSAKVTIRKSSELDPEKLYKQHWVTEGLSLRKIGRIYGVSRTTVQQVIRSKYGKDATNPRVNGLARLVAQEYGSEYKDLVDRAHGVTGRFLTTRKEANLTTFQALEYLDNFAKEDEEVQEVQEGLSLPLFTWFCRELGVILGHYYVLMTRD